ncbi:MAG: ribosome silencing factor [Deltaproteobacteria bacterium]|nr:ribosome silencing factor [Deltaproteobacteria bacterium]
MTKRKPPAPSVDLALVQRIADAAWSRKARDIVALDVRSSVFYADAMLICSGANDRHVRAIADAVAEAAVEAGLPRPLGEGRTHGRWILLDVGSVTVHVFHELLRELYELERLWGDAPRLTLELREDPGAAEGRDRE